VIKNEHITYKIKGLNFNKLINTLKKQNINILMLNKLVYNEFEIKIYKRDALNFENHLKNNGYTFKIIKKSKLLTFLDCIKKNIALFMVTIIVAIGLGFISNFVLQIKVVGNQNVSIQRIESVLKQNSIVKGKFKSSYNLNSIELLLKNSIEEISLVSCVLKGNTLLINLKEKIDNVELQREYLPILAPFNMLIKNVSVKSGTCVVSVNDTVKKDEAIVLPYINYKDGTKLKVQAQAEIEAYIELSNTQYYTENHQERVRTGKKHIQQEYSFYNFCWKGANKPNSFKDYEVEKKFCFVFDNMLLPIKQKTIYYYETTLKQVFKPFNKNLEKNLICENEKLLYNNVIDKVNLQDYSFFSTTKFADNMYLVTTYLKANVVLKY